MITITHGDILRATTEALVNTVNCIGVMGRGIALQFKKAFPDNFKSYAAACKDGRVKPGSVFVHDLRQLHNPRFIINFPTKRHWKGKSRMRDIESGLIDLVRQVRERNIRSIAIPPLGCGLGGLPWNEVHSRIAAAFSNLPEVNVILYEPSGAPAPETMVKADKKPRMTPGRASLLALIRRYLRAAMDPFVTLLEIHKLMYFMQEAGEELRLNYTKGTYGPYAENLRHVLNLLEGHFIQGYAEAGDAPGKEIIPLSGALDKAEEYLRGHERTSEHLVRVEELIKGFETPYGMELLATVHWLAKREGASSADDAALKTYAWNKRKQMFPEKHIHVAWDVLNREGWLG